MQIGSPHRPWPESVGQAEAPASLCAIAGANATHQGAIDAVVIDEVGAAELESGIADNDAAGIGMAVRVARREAPDRLRFGVFQKADLIVAGGLEVDRSTLTLVVEAHADEIRPLRRRIVGWHARGRIALRLGLPRRPFLRIVRREGDAATEALDVR